ncbi:MAG TPA: Uma2 family endonuclease [Blastocatellia bacterium]|nr:Uma2 family endonuclease [Blastocatellia bacterium]
MSTKAEATIEDLYAVSGKAEIVNGEIVLMSPTGHAPNRAAFKIAVSLYDYERRDGRGRTYSDNAAFIVNLPNRKSFSPDVAFHLGAETGMKFLEGAPVFAVEVRSENDYGPKAEQAMDQKRSDYFAAGTKVVWDVDLLSPDVIRSYDANNPDIPTIYRRGDIAKAEPALPEWEFPVEDLFQ